MAGTQAFNFIGQQPQPAPGRTPQSMLAQQALTLGGSSALQQAQESQYLADALASLQQSGAEASKTPLALGANLLADALLNYGRSRNNRAMMATVQNGQNSLINGGPKLPGQDAYDASLAAGAGQDPTGQASSAVASQGGGGAPPPAAPSPSPAGSATPITDAMFPAGGMPGGQGAPDHPIAAALAPQTPPPPISALNQMQIAHLTGDPAAFLGLQGWGVNSGARDAAHNAAVGGSPTSEHIPGNGYAFDMRPPAGMTTAQGLAQIRASGLPFDQAIDEGRDLHVGFRPQGAPGRGQIMRQTGPGQYQLIGNATGGPTQSGAPVPPGGQQPGGAPSADPASSLDAPNIHGGVQLSNGPMDSTPQSRLDPSLRAPIPQDPFAPSPSGVPMPPQLAQGGAGQWGAPGAPAGGPMPGLQGPPPAGPAPGGGQEGQITPKPFPIQPYQFQRLEQLAQAARAQPQLYLQSYLGYRQELADQASKPEELEISRPNDVGQITFTGKSSGRMYGVQQAPGFVSAAGPKMVMGPDGPRLVQGTGTRQLSPSAPGVETQQDMTGRITNEAIPNAVQDGQRWNPQTGSYEPLPGLQPQVSGGFAPGTVVSQRPGQSPTVVQAPPYTPQDLIAQRNAFKSGDTYRSYTNAATALNSLGTILQQATSNNGIVDMSVFDNLIRTQTGLSARQGNMAMMLEHLGFPAEAAGMVSNIAGNGFTAPDQIKSAYQALRGYTTTHGQIAQHELDEEAALAKRGGHDFGLTLPTLAPPPNVPWMGASNPAGGGGQSAASTIAAARAAIARGAPRAAVIERTRALGVDPSGL